MLTRQEMFDKAWIGLKSQGFEQSLDEDGDTCVYRGEAGRKCAIGWCIPDDKYHVGLEKQSPFNSGELRRAAGIADADARFASELQGVHDNSRSPAEMLLQIRAFAAEHNLTIPGEAA